MLELGGGGVAIVKQLLGGGAALVIAKNDLNSIDVTVDIDIARNDHCPCPPNHN